MADATLSKRPRDEPSTPPASLIDAGEPAKRQKPYEEILSLLDEEDDEPHQDLSHLITTLQQELSSPSSGGLPSAEAGGPGPEEDEGERVMRHLLEASDDELGLPSRSESGGGESVAEAGSDGGGPADGPTELWSGGLWELEDEAANYYALIQSELFMM